MLAQIASFLCLAYWVLNLEVNVISSLAWPRPRFLRVPALVSHRKMRLLQKLMRYSLNILSRSPRRILVLYPFCIDLSIHSIQPGNCSTQSRANMMLKSPG